VSQVERHGSNRGSRSKHRRFVQWRRFISYLYKRDRICDPLNVPQSLFYGKKKACRLAVKGRLPNEVCNRQQTNNFTERKNLWGSIWMQSIRCWIDGLGQWSMLIIKSFCLCQEERHGWPWSPWSVEYACDDAYGRCHLPLLHSQFLIDPSISDAQNQNFFTWQDSSINIIRLAEATTLLLLQTLRKGNY
jgi:hypothetical protein